MGVEERKREIRETIWRLMEERGIARFPLPVRGRIPNFIGAEKAAERLRCLPEYERANVIFCNPDSPQRPVREFALRDGKVLVIATPRLRKGFLVIEAGSVPPNRVNEASTISGAFKYGRTVDIPRLNVDLFVTGVVAVSPDGAKLGKGHGYGDLEYVILRTAGALGEEVPVVATAHDVQVVEGIPFETHDVPVDIIVTPTRVIRTNTSYPKPNRILWNKLTKEAIEKMPILKKLRIISMSNPNQGTNKQFL
ncbi:MAG: 5-formyltetrahydrofolate cyclo-ligase [Candidatus Baldrarchaeia archaeon]